MTQQTVYNIGQTDLDRFLQQASEKLITDRYSAREVTTPTVAEILGVSERTVNARVRTGKLKPLNPGSSKYRFRLSDIMQLTLN